MHVNGVMESVVRKLREEIVTGRLHAGSRLHEAELAERLGISRPPLREAFRTLSNENLVVCAPRKGCFVAPMSRGDCAEIYRVRQMVECTALDIVRQEGLSLAPLREALLAAQDMPEGVSTCDNFYLMSRFHLSLVECTGNRWLTHCHQGLRSSLARYQVMYLNLPGANAPSLDEHAQILALLEQGDFERAKAALVAHLNRTRQCLFDSMPGGGPAHDTR